MVNSFISRLDTFNDKGGIGGKLIMIYYNSVTLNDYWFPDLA
jgi:hypothetical protein